MTTLDNCAVFISFDGTAHVPSTWTEISDDVITCSFMRGRRRINEDWGPREAVIHLEDSARTYDPHNTSSIHSPNLIAGRQVKIEITHPSTGVTRTWKGVTREWAPFSWGGDGLGTTMLTCSDLMWALNRPVPQFANDMVMERLSRARAGVFYSFDYVNNPTGRIRDLSGKGSDGFAYTDELGATSGASQASPSEVTLNADSSITVPVPADFYRESPEGFFYVMRFKWTGDVSPSGPFEQAGIFGQGWLETAAPTIYDHGFAQITETRIGSATTNANPFGIRFEVAGNTIGTAISRISFAGTRVEWLNKDRVIILAYDQTNYTFRAVVHGGDGTIDSGKLIVKDSVAPPSQGSALGALAPSVNSVYNRIFRIGQTLRTQVSGNFTIPGFPGTVQLASFGHVSASQEWAEKLAEEIANGNGFIGSLNTDRATDLIEAMGIPISGWTLSMTSGVIYNDALPIGGVNGLGLFQQMVVTEQGRMYQTYDGTLEIEDFNAAGLRSDASAVATYADKSDASLLKYAELEMTSNLDDVVNRVEVNLPTGFSVAREDSASDTTYGTKSRTFGLPVQDEVFAARYTENYLERYKDQRPSITKVEIDPDAAPTSWWPVLMDSEIGDRITIFRQPFETGSVLELDSILEGDLWEFSNKEGWRITQYFSHVDAWKNTITYYEGTAKEDTMVLTKPFGVESGDTLIIVAACDYHLGGTVYGTAPTGFTKAAELGGAISDTRIIIYYRVADETEAATSTVTLDAGVGNKWMVGAYMRIPDGHATPLHSTGAGTLSAGPASTITALSMTPTVDDCLIMAVAAYDGAEPLSATTSGTNWDINLPARQFLKAGDNTNGVSLMIQTYRQGTAAASSDCTFTTNTSSSWGTFQSAWRPA